MAVATIAESGSAADLCGAVLGFAAETDEVGAALDTSAVIQVTGGYPDPGSVAAGVIYGPGGSLVGTLTYAGFATPGDPPNPLPSKRRSTPAPILDKRLSDVRLYDIDLTALLDDAETILYIKSITADRGSIGFGNAYINPAPVYYKLLDNWAAAGKVVQVLIQGGLLPSGVCDMECLCRLVVVTNENASIEAPFVLRLTNDVQ
jgi:hypothetical protein